MSLAKPVAQVHTDPVVSAFEDARPLDEPLTPEEIAAIETATSDARPASTTEEILARLRPKP